MMALHNKQRFYRCLRIGRCIPHVSLSVRARSRADRLMYVMMNVLETEAA